MRHTLAQRRRSPAVPAPGWSFKAFLILLVVLTMTVGSSASAFAADPVATPLSTETDAPSEPDAAVAADSSEEAGEESAAEEPVVEESAAAEPAAEEPAEAPVNEESVDVAVTEEPAEELVEAPAAEESVEAPAAAEDAVVQSAPTASLQSSSSDNAQANAKGNNGTIKMRDSANSSGKRNDPHLACDLYLRFFGFDAGTNTVVVKIEAQSPSGSGPVPISNGGRLNFTFEGQPGNSFDYEEFYQLDLSEFTAQQNQGYHIKWSASVNGGNDKHKVVWVEGCEEPPVEEPAELDVSVDKLNDADTDGEFSDVETALTAGQDVDFTALITNTSTVPVVIDSVEDAFGDVVLTDVCDELVGTTLAPRAFKLCEFTVADYAPATGDLENVVTVVVSDPTDPENTGEGFDDSTVNAPEPLVPPVLTVTVDKLNDADTDGEFSDVETALTAGQDVDFTALITNTSTVPVVIDSVEDAFGDVVLTDVCDELVGTTLAPRAFKLCEFTVADYAPATGDLENVVTVVVSDPTDPENTGEGFDDSTVNAPEPLVPPVLTVTVDKLNDADTDGTFTDTEPGTPGSAVTFTAELVNDSAVDVVIDSITDVVAGTSIPVECEEAFVGETVLAGDSLLCTFTVANYVPAAGSDDVVNRVTVVVTDPEDPTNTGEDFDDSTVEVPPPAGTPVLVVSVDKLNDADGDGTFTDTELGTPGEDVMFTAELVNDSEVDVVIDSITDVILGGATVPVECEDAFVGETVLAGDSLLCTFTVANYVPAAGSDDVVNRVTVEVSDPEDPTNSEEPFDDSTVEVPPASETPVRDLRIVKVDDVAGSGSVSPTETITYTVRVFNDGRVAESGFVVTDLAGDGLTFVSADGGSLFRCDGPVCEYVGPAVQPGGSVDLVVVATVDEDFDGTEVENTASVTVPPGDPTPGNNTDTEPTPVTTVLPATFVRDLQIVKQDNVESVRPGDRLTYSLVVTSVGNAAVPGFTVRDTLPTGLSLISAGGDGFQCNTSEALVCSFAGSLAPGQSATITVVALVSATYSGSTIVNTAVVPLEGDPTPRNNTSTETTPVTEVLGVAFNRPAAPQPPAAVSPAPAQAPTTLPFTGADTADLAASALGLLLLGALATAIGRRRQTVPVGEFAARQAA